MSRYYLGYMSYNRSLLNGPGDSGCYSNIECSGAPAGVGMAYAAMAEEEQKQQGSNPAVAHSVVEKPAKRSGRGFAASNQ